MSDIYIVAGCFEKIATLELASHIVPTQCP